MRPEVERIEQPAPYVDEGDYYDDPDEVQARKFMTPLLVFLVLVFATAFIYAIIRA